MFFAMLTSQGLSLEQKDRRGKPFTWPKAELFVESMVPFSALMLTCDEDVWTKPERLNEPGFDALHVKPNEKKIELFKITQGASDSLNLIHAFKCLRNLESISEFEIFVYVVVPVDKLNNFKLKEVTGEYEIQRTCKGCSIETNVAVVGIAEI